MTRSLDDKQQPNIQNVDNIKNEPNKPNQDKTKNDDGQKNNAAEQKAVSKPTKEATLEPSKKEPEEKEKNIENKKAENIDPKEVEKFKEVKKIEPQFHEKKCFRCGQRKILKGICQNCGERYDNLK